MFALASSSIKVILSNLLFVQSTSWVGDCKSHTVRYFTRMYFSAIVFILVIMQHHPRTGCPIKPCHQISLQCKRITVNNEVVLLITQIIKAVMSSAAEAEIGVYSIICCKAMPRHHTLYPTLMQINSQQCE